MGFHHPPCVMANTDQFFVRVCPCGVVHLSFGATIVNVTAETAIAITETLKEISQGLRSKIEAQESNVIRGHFPSLT